MILDCPFQAIRLWFNTVATLLISHGRSTAEGIGVGT